MEAQYTVSPLWKSRLTGCTPGHLMETEQKCAAPGDDCAVDVLHNLVLFGVLLVWGSSRVCVARVGPGVILLDVR